jgi:hypothetical protein
MAAASLLGEPGLGREVSEAYAEGSGPLALGQRLYYLAVPNTGVLPVATGDDSDASADSDTRAAATSDASAAPSAPAGNAPAPAAPRTSDARAVIDAAAGTVTVTIFASEAEAQGIATRLRRREPLGASLAALRRIYGPAIGSAIATGRPARIRIRSEAEGEVDTEDLVRRAYRSRRPYAVRRRVFRPLAARRRGYGWRRQPRHPRRRLLASWTARALASELARTSDAFLQAVDAPVDGVTIVLRMRPPGLRAMLVAGAVNAAAAMGPGPVQVEILPGPPRA